MKLQFAWRNRCTCRNNLPHPPSHPCYTIPIMPDALDRIEITTGDITARSVDAIVNAANESLLGGGGVDGAMHCAAGPGLLKHNRSLGGCATGLATITPAFDLESHSGGRIRHIIHTVGPVWSGDGETIGTREADKLGDRHEDVLLASCYHQCLTLAKDHEIHSLAFPSISTGVYRFPKVRAAKIAFAHVLGWLNQHTLPQRVIFCCFSDDDAAVYRNAIDTRDDWMLNRKRA